jgi:hypothetical protein
MTPLRVEWDPGRTYRCFVDRAAGKASLVGSRLTDDAIGHQIGPVVIVVDTAGTVCDLELSLTPPDAPAVSSVSAPENDVVRVDEVVTTTITAGIDPSVVLEDDWLIVSFIDKHHATW